MSGQQQQEEEGEEDESSNNQGIELQAEPQLKIGGPFKLNFPLYLRLNQHFMPTIVFSSPFSSFSFFR